jgi:nucleoside-diphosphate-sugar epimerase
VADDGLQRTCSVTIFVTGAAEIFGYHVSKALLDRGE